MHRIIVIVGLITSTLGCTPGYRWVNTDFEPEKMQDNFYLDKGDCMRMAGESYPDPPYMRDPDELYYECMANTDRIERYPVQNEDGDVEYRTVRRRGNPWLCRPSRALQAAYREYETELREKQINRARYVNSCMSAMGWERIENENQN